MPTSKNSIWYEKSSAKWFLICLFFISIFSIRLAFGLYSRPTQPIRDEVQTYLIGLKYFTTNEWPYYGNDVIIPPENMVLQTQDPGALEGLIIGLPLRVWPNPLAPIIALNIFSMLGFTLLAFYGARRVPKLPTWFVYTWVLLAPWCVHYSTSMVNLSYTITIGCFFFIAWMESTPLFSLGLISPTIANLSMGFWLSAWAQLHRTCILAIPFILISFYLQWKETKKLNSVFQFILGAIPLSLLIIPTLFQENYHLIRDVNGFSYGFNIQNFLKCFVILAQFLSLASFELPRFLGQHTAERWQYMTHHFLLSPGLFLWYFGILQPLILVGFLFDSKNLHKEWKSIRLLLIYTFLLIFGCLLFTVKTPDVNTFCETLPIPMIYSLYVWERWWTNRWGKLCLQFFIVCVIIFQFAYPFDRISAGESFYLIYKDKVSQAIEKGDYHLLGERRPGSFY